MKKNDAHYRSWPAGRDYIRSDACEFPQRLKDMLIEIDERSDEIFARIESLPLVLCHRDFWSANLIHAGGTIALIDWDTAGWGRAGEDLASLIADETDPEHMVEYYRRCVPAYHKGFSEEAQIPYIEDHCVYEMILLVFGYRLVGSYLRAEDDRGKKNAVRALEKIHEMKSVGSKS
uniref:phosphotransferase family protein n=1 Tax=Saccharibacillus sp. CPCC 101409 TaxID=3058041 RepID=UPI0034A083EA